MNEDTYPPETLELIYNEVKDALNTQFQSMEGLNTKASVIIGFVGVIIGISLNLYSDENSHLFIGSMLLFLGAAFLSFFAYKVKSYRRDPEPRALTIKVKCINYSLILLFMGLIVLISSIIVG
jgi:hypothetical protein